MVNESYYYVGATGEYWYYSVLTFDGKVFRVREDNLQKYSNRLNKFRSGCNSGYGELARERIEASRPLVAAHQAIIKAAHTKMRSAEHTSELQSLMRTPYAVVGMKKPVTTAHNIHSISSHTKNQQH